MDGPGRNTSRSLDPLIPKEDYERFKAKARQFLKAHEAHVSLRRLMRNQPLTKTDLSELERMLLEAGSAEFVERAKEEEQGLGMFIRSLVGLDREAAKEAFAGFLSDNTASANQIEFVIGAPRRPAGSCGRSTRPGNR